MANTYWIGVADGVTQDFTIPFPYVNRNDVQVYLNNIQQQTPGNYVFLNDQTIRFFGTPLSQAVVKLQRSTSPNSPDVAYQNGAVLTADDLNVGFKQNFYRTQELQDELDSYISGGLSAITTLGNASAYDMIKAAAQSVLQSQLLADLQSQIGNVSLNAQNIISQTLRVDTMQTIIDGFNAFGGVGIGTFITNEQSQRIAADQATASTIALIGAKNAGNTSFVLNMATTKVDATTSLGDYLSGIITKVNTNTAAISTETSTRVTAVQAVADSVTSLSATLTSNVGTLNAAIGAEQTARVNQDNALSSLISALRTDVNSNSAAITTEQTARANAVSANASSISALQTTVGQNTSAIQSTQSSVNGIMSEYTVKVDTNGYVAGFGLLQTLSPTGGVTSDFTVLANRFSIVDPGNGVTTPKVPFTIQNGIVYMQNVVIGDALIGSLTVSKLTQGSLNADMAIGTGRIVFDNGAFMKVIGVGFGTRNQFIEWFGPHQASYNSCSEANAIAYLRTDGSAYFGGTLLAGVLHNATQATVLNSSNVADLGPFASNGHTITVTASFSFDAVNTFAPGATAAYNAQVKQNPSAVVVLSRSQNGGSFVDVATMNVTGSWTSTPPTGGDPGFYRQTMGASTTFTDTANVAQVREYKLRFISWANVNANVNTNTLAIQTTES